jgi:hypothetical protein
MKAKTVYILIITLAACNLKKQDSQANSKTDSVIVQDTNHVKNETVDTVEKTKSRIYSNERFKDVTVENMVGNKFLIKGKAQVFEAAFSWVIEDGHEEIKKGFEMTDAGAPEWGNFSFTVEESKKRANSTLHLILFESSAKDGSRQYELPVLLY